MEEKERNNLKQGAAEEKEKNAATEAAAAEREAASAGIAAAANGESLRLHSAAAKEHLVAYSGIDNETGQRLTRSLKDVAESKVNPQYAEQNLKQQAGFSAEIKETARANEENILNKTGTRKIRTDDMGRVNDPLYDHMELDAQGQIIPGSGGQMKFVGKSPQECLDKLMSTKYQKYVDHDVSFEVPSDYYDGIKEEIAARTEKLERQLDAAKRRGKDDVAAQKRKQIEKLKKIKNGLKKSRLSNDEALEARQHPKLSTAKEINRLSHQTGVGAAKSSALIGGGLSLVQNAVAVMEGKLDADEALANTAATAVKAGASGYAIGYGTTALMATMRNSSTALMRTLSNTGLPAAVVSSAVLSVQAVCDCLRGKISAGDCLQQVGKNTLTVTSSMAYATAGQALIPIPVVGAVVGGLAGYALTAGCLASLMEARESARLAHEERLRVEAECNQAIAAIRSYRAEMNRYTTLYFTQQRDLFNASFAQMKKALMLDDVDGFIDGVNHITRGLGGDVEFNTLDEFETRMDDDTPFKL